MENLEINRISNNYIEYKKAIAIIPTTNKDRMKIIKSEYECDKVIFNIKDINSYRDIDECLKIRAECKEKENIFYIECKEKMVEYERMSARRDKIEAECLRIRAKRENANNGLIELKAGLIESKAECKKAEAERIGVDIELDITNTMHIVLNA